MYLTKGNMKVYVTSSLENWKEEKMKLFFNENEHKKKTKLFWSY